MNELTLNIKSQSILFPFHCLFLPSTLSHTVTTSCSHTINFKKTLYVDHLLPHFLLTLYLGTGIALFMFNACCHRMHFMG